MANVTIVKNLIEYTIDSFSSEDSNFPASNLLLFDKRIRFAKTTDTTEQWWIINLGAPKALNAVDVIDANFTNYTIQGNTTNSFITPPFDWTGLTTAQDKFTDIYRSHKNPQSPGGGNPAFNYQYLRLVIPAQSTTDGASQFRLGVLAVSVDSEAMLRSPQYGMELLRDQAELEEELHGGGIEYATTGVPFLRLTFDIITLRQTAEFANLAKQLISIGKNELIAISFSDQMKEDPNGQYVYIVKRETKPKYQLQIAGEMNEISFRELI